jgi:hypothetical protein
MGKDKKSVSTNSPLTLEHELEEWLEEWKSILRLQDWSIDVRIVRSFEMDMTVGDVIRHPEQRHAIVRILDPRDIDPESPTWQRDVESTLVHELLHVVFYSVDHVDETAEMIFEQGINSTADALVTLLRGDRPRDE